MAVKRPLWWALTLLWMAGTFYLSSQSGGLVGLPAPWDKVAHFSSYAALGFLATRASATAWQGWGIAALYGISDEWHQSFVPMRDASAWDWLADALGAALGSRLAAIKARASG